MWSAVDIEDALTATYEGRTYYFAAKNAEEFREAQEPLVIQQKATFRG